MCIFGDDRKTIHHRPREAWNIHRADHIACQYTACRAQQQNFLNAEVAKRRQSGINPSERIIDDRPLDETSHADIGVRMSGIGRCHVRLNIRVFGADSNVIAAARSAR